MSKLLDFYKCTTRKGYRTVHLALLAEVKLGIEAEDAMFQGHCKQWKENLAYKGAPCLFCKIHARKTVPSSSGALLGRQSLLPEFPTAHDSSDVGCSSPLGRVSCTEGHLPAGLYPAGSNAAVFSF